MEKLTVAYIRCSTDEQYKTGYSVESQREELIRGSERYGLHIDRFYVDDGYSASNLNRPDIQSMLMEIKNEKIGRILIRHSDRLIRNIILKRALERVFDIYEIEIISFNDDTNRSTPEEELFSDMVALWNENELRKISPRTIKGLRGSAECGNYPISNIPVGYRKEENKKKGKGFYLVPDEASAPIVQKIFNTLATNQINVEDLVKWLRTNKVLERKWTREMILNIVDNPIYYGRLVTGWFDSDDASIPYEVKENWYSEDCHTQPLVTKELWNQTQLAVHHKKKPSYHRYYFDRLVFDNENKTWLSNESAWKTNARGERVLYKYYVNHENKVRISESALLKEFMKEFNTTQIYRISEKKVKECQDKIKKKKSRIRLLKDDYDNGLMNKEDYVQQRHMIDQEIRRLYQLEKELNDSEEIDFKRFSEEKKCAVIATNLERVVVYPQFKTYEFIFKDMHERKKKKQKH